jgi:catalase (peroxidase I)
MIGGLIDRTWRVFLVGLIGFAFMHDAAAGQYNCEVPVAVLCQGCATGVSIALQAHGGCRVSFNPASTAAAAQFTGTVSFRILTPTATAFRKVSYRNRIAPPPSPRGSCFSFNGHQYCE